MRGRGYRPIKYTIDYKSLFGFLSIAFMVLSAVFRIIGVSGMGHDKFFIASQVVLPLCANLLFIMAIVVFGKSDFNMTVYPVICGVIFFAVKAFTFDSKLHTFLCLLLYITVLVVYIMTVKGRIPTKYILVPLFGLPLVYHIFVEDTMKIIGSQFTFSTLMQEISVLMIMASLECLPWGMREEL